MRKAFNHLWDVGWKMVVCTAVFALGARAQAEPVTARVLHENSLKELLAGPASIEAHGDWLAAMLAYRAAVSAEIHGANPKTGDAYANPALDWAQRSFIQPQMMAHERYFYDPATRNYTVDRYLDDLQRRYGGIDSVLIWPTYPNIGVDNRNQFDLWRDMPGGIRGLRRMVDDFHRRGVRVLLPIMYWDHGTRDEGVPMAKRMAGFAREIGADGLNGDTMSPVTAEFYTESVLAGHPLALEPENGLADQIQALKWNVLSWGYWWPYEPMLGVDRYKWIEPRHRTHVCDRWAHDRTDMLQYAFFNGDGYESWENVWGIWNGITPRDAEALRRMSAIYRVFPANWTSPDYEPFAPTSNQGVYASKFPAGACTLWTVINRNDHAVDGPELILPPQPAETRYFDLWSGQELKPEVSREALTLSFAMEGRGFGAVLATRAKPDRKVRELLATMRQRSHWKLADLSSKWEALPQQIVEIPKTTRARTAPEGMVLIPGGRFHFKAEGVMIERSEGVDVQYPWESKPALQHEHEVQVSSFYVDRTPVTCAQFKRFLDATHYQPKDLHDFLRPWINGSYPTGWEKKPVTWVALEDARAYAKWAGKRLPHEWEWQYAAQGNDGRLYPWGNETDKSRMPPFCSGREQRPPTDVDDYPQGASPYGVLDLVGNVWQWTDEFRDEHTRAAILKGGSYYRPEKSGWYFPQAPQLNQHGKYLLMAPSIDRSATIGFRCVMEAP